MRRPIDDVHKAFVSNLEKTVKISELYDLIIEVAAKSIKSLGLLRSKMGGDAGKNQIDMLSKLKDNPQIKEVLPVVSGQQVVLFVSSFESYLKELAKLIGDDHIGLIAWPEKSSGKIDLTVLSGRSVTMGDLVLAILEQHDINFQDLKSTKRFFEEYIGINLEIDEQYEQNIILAAAIRHSIVHSGGIADDKFVKQIRNLPDSVRKRYKHNRSIEIDGLDISTFRDSFINFSQALKDGLNKRITDSQLGVF